MKNERQLLFVGGPVHGKRYAVRQPRIEFPVLDDTQDLFPSARPDVYVGVHSVSYREQMIDFGRTRIRIMAPESYSIDESMRALADFIEGTAR